LASVNGLSLGCTRLRAVTPPAAEAAAALRSPLRPELLFFSFLGDEDDVSPWLDRQVSVLERKLVDVGDVLERDDDEMGAAGEASTSAAGREMGIVEVGVDVPEDEA
jgi:hypothetical protein